MKRVNKSKLIEEYQLKPFGAKGWLGSKSLVCPFCGKGDKFGVKLEEDGRGVFHCFKCDKKGSITFLMKAMKREDLIVGTNNVEYTLNNILDGNLSVQPKRDIDLECPEIKPPLGFKALKACEYLEQRGWEPWQLQLYHAGTSIEPKLKDKITFLLYEEGKIIGYLSRSKKSKEWHKKNLKDHKEGKCRLVLRYDNSPSTPFERVVGGIDEIVQGQTKTVLLVEGIMDKANTDKVLHLNESPEVKCCFTFGCKLSESQMMKLYNKGVETIILLYDPGTIQQVKSASLKLSKKFNIKVGELTGEKDPGEMSYCEFEKVFLHLMSPMEYYANRMLKLNLK